MAACSGSPLSAAGPDRDARSLAGGGYADRQFPFDFEHSSAIKPRPVRQPSLSLSAALFGGSSPCAPHVVRLGQQEAALEFGLVRSPLVPCDAGAGLAVRLIPLSLLGPDVGGGGGRRQSWVRSFGPADAGFPAAAGRPQPSPFFAAGGTCRALVALVVSGCGHLPGARCALPASALP